MLLRYVHRDSELLYELGFTIRFETFPREDVRSPNLMPHTFHKVQVDSREHYGSDGGACLRAVPQHDVEDLVMVREGTNVVKNLLKNLS